MDVLLDPLDHDLLPDAKTILFTRPDISSTFSGKQPGLRRSPRKQGRSQSDRHDLVPPESCLVTATSNQRRLSPSKPSPTKYALTTASKKASQTSVTLSDDIPILPRKSTRQPFAERAGNGEVLEPLSNSSNNNNKKLSLTHVDSLLLPLSRMVGSRKGPSNDSDSEPAFVLGKAKPKTRNRSSSAKSVMSLMTEAARNAPLRASPEKGVAQPQKRTDNMSSAAAKRFVLGEAACLQDLADSDADEESEDEDTDLSGFIVDDSAELSYHESMESGSDHDSEAERRSRKRSAQTQSQTTTKPRRRLHRGRKIVQSEDEAGSDADALTSVFKGMKLDERSKNDGNTSAEVEVVNLVSPDPTPNTKTDTQRDRVMSTGINLFNKLNALRLSPPPTETTLILPPKPTASVPSDLVSDAKHSTREDNTVRPTTPVATPPQSPTKLKSPSKLLSPSKRKDIAHRSPHRQSTDAFWDLGTVNEWNDQYSPKKAPLASPRKALKHFDLWSDSDTEDSVPQLEESSDGLPSPCESPSKTRTTTSTMRSPEKVERLKAQEAKRSKLAQKREFDAKKEAMAKELFDFLDQNITGGQISRMAANTGGVAIIWSKTLRSTAGRANWKKTRSTSSPIKTAKSGIASPSKETVRHFANIELAVKVIDRPERLYDTLSHEFCHLANFMVSGVLDQPHGTAFQKWAAQTTRLMQDQSGRPEWREIQITTKHGYVIEHKYLWVCTGRTKAMAMAMSGMDDDNEIDGCGAEYGRHSKSIDTEKDRCGVCKGMLIQVRPKPRASPQKKLNSSASPMKKVGLRLRGTETKDVEQMIKEIEVIDLSD